MTDLIRVLIVDDEPLARTGLRKLCEGDPEVEVVGECADGRGAVAAIEQVEPDLLFLDIQMPGMDGFEVLRAVGPEAAPRVIFVTAYDQFALRAFEVHALDYLLKPFGDKRFHDALSRAKKAVRRAAREDFSLRLLAMLEAVGLETGEGAGSPRIPFPPSAGGPPHASRIVVKERGRVFLVRTGEIDWIEAADYYAKLHVGERVHLIRESMKSLDARLDPARFFRVSRSAIVNLDRIQELQPLGRGALVVILKNGTRVTLSRTRREALTRVLGEPL